jgi:hypothetical protein
MGLSMILTFHSQLVEKNFNSFDMEVLFSLWQESKWKDVERFFGVFKKKFHFFARPIPFAFIEDILDAFYCTLISHHMAVQEQIDMSADGIKSVFFYDGVEDPEAVDDVQREARINPAMQYTNMDEEHVKDRVLEVENLSALVIHVLDSTLSLHVERISLLPQYQQVAQYQWNQLYRGNNHLKLSKAIAWKLKCNYDAYKRRINNS